MGYIYLPSTTSTTFRTALTTLTTLTPESNRLVYKNGGYENSKVEAEKHYVISESELKALKIQVEESRISFNGKTSVNFYPERKLKKIKSLDIQLGHVYFFKSAGSHKVGCSCVKNIKNRVRSQCPDEVIAVSEARKDYKELEKTIHKMFAKNQVGRYEIFNDLTENDIQKIKRLLGNKIAVDIRLRKR